MSDELIYLYCFREKTESPPFSAQGVDGKGEVFSIPARGLEAIVSKVSSEEFDSETVQIKAREDPNWIKEKALAHEKVIEEAMRKDDNFLSLIPIRFGTIFKEEAGLKKTLDKDYSKIEQVLEKIRGKQEWSVKVYLKDKGKFEQAIKKGNPAIKEKEKEITSLPEGMAFFMEEELKELVSQEAEKEINNIAESIFESLKKHTANSARNKILKKELTGRREPMVLNAAYLVAEEKIEDFRKGIEDLNQKMQVRGFCLEYSGPWPAFNFTQLAD